MLLLELLPLGCRLHHSPTWKGGAPPTEVRLQGVAYQLDAASALEGWLGFFDWLRTDPATVVGVRLCLFTDLPYQAWLHRYPYAVALDNDQVMEILFRPAMPDHHLSSDQDFGPNYAYRHADRLLLTFPTDHLTEAEWASLRALCQPLQE